jgi:glycosyltransferase involved in cell wall biosynthesis
VRIVFFNRFFYPDTSATSQILSDLAFHLASKGFEVHAVTSYSDGASCQETIHGAHVHRVSPASTGTHGLFRRALAYARYYVGARRAAKRLVQAGDIVVLKTDPPLLAPAMAGMVKTRGAKLVLWLQDLFPEVAKAHNVPGLKGPVYSGIRRARDAALERADAIVVIAESMASKLPPKSHGRVAVVHNWADGNAVAPRPVHGNPLRSAWGLAGKFVVVYSGNFGRVHEFATILGAAHILRAETDIVFLMVGRGPRLEDTRRRAANLPNIQFRPHQPRELLPEALAMADVHLSVLRPEFEGLVHPSKLYGIMAAGRPTVFVGSANGESAVMLRESKCGLSVPTGDSQALALAIVSLRDDPERARAMGKNARDAFDAQFDRAIAFASWERILASLGARVNR